MKTKMSLMVLSTLGLLMSQVGQAQVGPVLQPEFCAEGQNIKFPEGANGTIYMSKDCKTAFVLPNDKSPLRINALATSPGVNQKDCTRVEELADDEKYWDSIIKRQKTTLTELDDDYKKEKESASSQEEKDRITNRYIKVKESIEKSIAEDQKSYEVAKNRDRYGKMEGMAINFHLALEQNEVVDQFSELNKDSGLSFKAAPISKGIISFTNGLDTDISYRRVLVAKIPGLSPDLEKQEVEDSYVLANGGLSGMIKLSQPAVCDIIKKLQPEGATKYDVNILRKDPNLVAGFVANYIYEVPVTASIGFKFVATTTGNDLSTTFKKSIIKDRYTRDEISALVMDGGLDETIKISFNDGGLPFTLKEFMIKNDSTLNQPQGNLINIFLEEGLELYKDKVAKQLEFMNDIQKEMVDSANEIPTQQEVANVITLRHESCKTKRDIFGRKKKKCSTKTTNETHYVAGKSFGTVHTMFSQKIGVNMELDANQTIPMIHTTGFGPIEE